MEKSETFCRRKERIKSSIRVPVGYKKVASSHREGGDFGVKLERHGRANEGLCSEKESCRVISALSGKRRKKKKN